MMLNHHLRDWEDLAEQDPLWAILSVDEKARGGWDMQEFFDTGGPEMHRIMAHARRLGHPIDTHRALDFGCGVGRVTRAMSHHFDVVVGVDISPTMLESARRLNEAYPTCEFEFNDRPDLESFGDREFDFIYSSIVLQHVPGRETIEAYIREFVRVLRPGGLIVFQLPSAIPARYRLQPRRRAYSVLRSLGVSPSILRARLRLHPIRMNSIPEPRVVEVLDAEHADLLEVERSVSEEFGIRSCTYWVTRA
jgi:SAM-dependent methyltransferase